MKRERKEELLQDQKGAKRAKTLAVEDQLLEICLGQRFREEFDTAAKKHHPVFKEFKEVVSKFPPSTEFHKAVLENDIDALRSLDSKKAAVDECSNPQSPALFWACALGNKDAVSLLLEYKADISARNIYDAICFNYAAKAGNDEVFRFLLEKGSLFPETPKDIDDFIHSAMEYRRINSITSFLTLAVELKKLEARQTCVNLLYILGCTSLESFIDFTFSKKQALIPYVVSAKNPILLKEWLQGDDSESKALRAWQDENLNSLYHHAAMKGNIETLDVIDLFSESKAYFNSSNKDGDNPIILASGFSGQTEIFQRLVDRYPALALVQNYSQENPYHRSIGWGHIENVKVLLAKSAFDRLLTDRRKDGFTPIALAVKNSHLEIVKLLVEKDAGLLNWRGEDGETLLHVAARAVADFVEDMLDFLVSRPQLSSHLKTEAGGYSPLSRAAGYGNVKAFKWFVRRDPSTLIWEGEDGETFCCLAAKYGHVDILRLLDRLALILLPSRLERLSDILPGLTPYLPNILGEDAPLLELKHRISPKGDLISRALDIEEEDDDGYNPLFYAIGAGEAEAAEWLVKMRPRLLLGTCGNQGWTVWHQLAEFPSARILEYLKKLPASSLPHKFLKDQDGLTPLEYARRNSKPGAAEFADWLSQFAARSAPNLFGRFRRPLSLAQRNSVEPVPPLIPPLEQPLLPVSPSASESVKQEEPQAPVVSGAPAP